MESLSLTIPILTSINVEKSTNQVSFEIGDKPLSEKVKILILRDLLKLGWDIDFKQEKIQVSAPNKYDKATIKHAMSIRRSEIIVNNKSWIEKHLSIARENLANGTDVLKTNIQPIIEVCETKKQHDLFRILRYYWSSPYSEYVGRRIKLIIRDKSLPNKPVIGIAALGSPIIHIPERDAWIGWDKETRTRNLVYTMDAYVIGAMPPYNYMLGGKLISYILASKEVRKIYSRKYKDKITLIEGRTANKLAGIFTTSLYGRSSQYNRLKYNNELLYIPIGETKGYGTLHLSEETLKTMQEYLRSNNIIVSNSFGSGPSWTMRMIRQVGDLLGFDSELLLQHSFKRNIYFVPLAKNYKEFLTGSESRLKYENYSIKELSSFWRDRWLEMRKENVKAIESVSDFRASDFKII